MPGRWTSTLRWADVPPEQRETPAEGARALLDWSHATRGPTQSHRANAMIGDMMRPWLRGKLARHQAREAGESACPMATRQSYDRILRHWTYAPCGLVPRSNGYCWRHQPEPDA